MSGGSTQQTQQTQLPKWFEDYTRMVTQQAQQGAGIGYVPWSGPDVAALSPMQNAAFQGTNTMAAAYGLPQSEGTTGMGQPQRFAGGAQGYSSFPLYQQQIRQLQRRNPEQFGLLSGFGNTVKKDK